jgi:hypothetical protein
LRSTAFEERPGGLEGEKDGALRLRSTAFEERPDGLEGEKGSAMLEDHCV